MALKMCYMQNLTDSMPLLWNKDFRLNSNDIYTSLDLVSHKSKHRASGGVEGEQRQELKSLDDLFNPDITGLSIAPKCTLIEGEPGIGKTTWMSKQALDWASQESQLSQHDIVLLIRLREVTEEDTIVDIVWDQCVPEHTKGVDVESIREILQRNESRVIFLLDGYDELQPEARAAGQAIPKLLSGKLYPNSNIVITSRPSAGVQQHVRLDCHLYMMGFSQEHVNQYVQKYFQSNPRLAQQLIHFIKRKQIDTTFIQTPIFLMFICILWEVDREMVATGTITGLYDKLVTCLFMRHWRHCVWEGVTDITLDMLPAVFEDSLQRLGKLALEALLKNESLVDLNVEQRDTAYWELLLKIGVVSMEVSASRLHPREQLNFTHKTMQEFLAGRYVAYALANLDIFNLLQLTSITKAFKHSNLLQFICGNDSRAAVAVMKGLGYLSNREFASLQAEQFEWSSVPIDKSIEKCETYQRFAKLCLNILNERKEPEVLHAFSQALPIVILDASIDSRESRAFLYYIQNLQSAKLPDRLMVKIHGDTDSRDIVQYLQQCFTTSFPELKLDLKLSGHLNSPDQTISLISVLKNVPRLRALDLSSTNLTPSSLHPLVQGFRHIALLEVLDLLENNDIGDNGMNVLKDGLMYLRNLAVLRLGGVGMTAVGMSSLVPYMRRLVTLRELHIGSNKIGNSGLASLNTILSTLTAMQVLVLSGNVITTTGMLTLVHSLCKLTGLIILDISYIQIGDIGLECLADILPQLKAMKTFKLCRIGISDRGLSALISTKVLPQLAELEVLDLSWNDIGDSGIVSLVHSFGQFNTQQTPPGDQGPIIATNFNTTLLELNIGFNSRVTGVGLGRVAQLINQLLALARLNMSTNAYTHAHLSDIDAMALAQSVIRLPALEQLDLWNVSMDPAGFQVVMQAAEDHPTLELLHFSSHLLPEKVDVTASCMRTDPWHADRQCIPRYIFFIKNEVSEMWKVLAYYLDFDSAEIRSIAARNKDDRSCCWDLLMEWKKQHGNVATIDVLIEALNNAGLHNVVYGLRDEFPEIAEVLELKGAKGAIGEVKKFEGSGTKPVVLFINDEYGSSKVGVSTINHQEACLLASRGAKVYSTVLDATQEDKDDAAADGVELIFPTTFKGDTRMPSLEWLTDHQVRYPNLPSDVDFIVGHVNFTSRAARRIKDRLPHAKLVQVTHMVPEETSDEKVLSFWEERANIHKDLQHANVVFSVGPDVYDYYLYETRPTIPHFQFLPKPSDIFSKTSVTYGPTRTKVVLSIGRVKGVERLKGCDLAAKAMSVVIHHLPHARWQGYGVSSDDFPDSKAIVQANVERGNFNFTPLMITSQKELVREMQGANVVLMPSYAEPFSLIGLEAIAAGVPVLVSQRSGLARFLQSQDPEFDRTIVEIKDDDDMAAQTLAKHIIRALSNGRREFVAARMLKEKLLASHYWEESHRKFLETFGL